MLTAVVIAVTLSADPNREYRRLWAEIGRSHNAAWDASIRDGIEKERVGGVQRHIANQPYVAHPSWRDARQVADDQYYFQQQQIRELQNLNRILQRNEPYYVPYYPQTYRSSGYHW